ncbi:class I SAM-dependent methyltransferase [Arcobacter cryaerophilus gv. pseudocryaerophilus]|uniref:Class I SAM-dependent methyltransferase n=3 Tax=Arcobacteraceae TaxID=2808963 RepID=A0AA96IIW4_9BACT|nr:class I SAM-dependent methyltransferase [Arcobacter sp. AZ-2023]WNL35396.1 class I SAM-dependent methyltransferase [Arcobacter sp. AZ-2023]WPD11112.1 class I SAM-dependent methyltransferase [Arcobacter sp. DSM 115960]
MQCRFCKNKLEHVFVDLINTPASNSFLTKEQLNEPEHFYPLKLFVCENCKLVQIDEYKKSDDIFNQDYAYFSSYSTSWLKHAENYVEMIVKKLSLNETSYITEIASNDGYLLQYFQEKQIPCIGIEPTSSTASVAKQKAIEVIEDFFNTNLAKTLKKSDLIIGNNVLAHVPDINDFVKGLKIALKNNGIITMEFPHLLNIINENQFDTIYHEHFSYLSLYTLIQIFEKQELKIFDVEKLATHGGSLRIYATHIENNNLEISENVENILNEEKEFGLFDMNIYTIFQEKANKVKYDLLEFLLQAKKENKKVVAYGAAAKGNTLLNYAGIKNDLIEFVVDKSPYKQGKFMPASHIPVVEEKEIQELKPDYILILPWNIKDEIIAQLNYVKMWNCKFVVAVPQLEIIN